MEDDDDNEVTDCPNCGRTYDDADSDFLICHHCGFNAVEKTIDLRKVSRNISRYGIDPDVRLDDWS